MTGIFFKKGKEIGFGLVFALIYIFSGPHNRPPGAKSEAKLPLSLWHSIPEIFFFAFRHFYDLMLSVTQKCVFVLHCFIFHPE